MLHQRKFELNENSIKHLRQSSLWRKQRNIWTPQNKNKQTNKQKTLVMQATAHYNFIARCIKENLN